MSRAFALIIIGSELLSGKRNDSHMQFAIDMLAKRGLELDRVCYLGDDRQRLTQELANAMASNDITFSFGGIGATPDDHTRQCAALACGVALRRHDDAARVIEERFGEAAYPQRIQMAHLPVGAQLIPNPVNQIAGFSLNDVHFVPGFPKMAWPMLEWVMDRYYSHLARIDDAPYESMVTVPGVSEGQLMGIMQEFVDRFASVRLSCLPHMDGEYRETELGVRGRQGDVAHAIEWLMDRLMHDGHRFRKGGR